MAVLLGTTLALILGLTSDNEHDSVKSGYEMPISMEALLGILIPLGVVSACVGSLGTLVAI